MPRFDLQSQSTASDRALPPRFDLYGLQPRPGPIDATK
jgi:hypothetical protein